MYVVVEGSKFVARSCGTLLLNTTARHICGNASGKNTLNLDVSDKLVLACLPQLCTMLSPRVGIRVASMVERFYYCTVFPLANQL